jgi:hypothetical protein
MDSVGAVDAVDAVDAVKSPFYTVVDSTLLYLLLLYSFCSSAVSALL